MSQFTVTLQMSAMRTKVLVVDGSDEILRAVLPAPTQVRNTRAAATLLEGLSLWLDRPLRVVVSAGELDGSWSLGLTDDVGIPQRSVFYTVDVIEKGQRRRNKTVGGIGDFRDLRQMVLLDGGRR